MRPRFSLPLAFCSVLACAASDANRFAVLDEFCDIYYPGGHFPKLTTPQWIGEPGVDLALVLAIDDMRDHKPYEAYLRPLLERLKAIDGRAPVSIMTCSIDPKEPHLQTWLAEGVSIEAHTVDHPCPILDKGNFGAAKSTYDRCVDRLFEVPSSHPVAFRTPCMDGINSASPRLFAEVMLRTTGQGNFLTISSSIGLLLTPDHPENPRELVASASGKSRFEKYLLPGYINYIQDYPYPYLIGNKFWEAPFCIPDDYEGSRVHGDKGAATVADMKASIDAVAARQGLWVFTFHPYQWLAATQAVELVEHTVSKHGPKARFLNFREMNERLEKHLLAGQKLRAPNGGENGVRLLDLNDDGFLDVIVANEHLRQTRVWSQSRRAWDSSSFPVAIALEGRSTGVRFGILDNAPVAFLGNEREHGFWRFSNGQWNAAPELLAGLELGGERVRSSVDGKDRGVRFRDVNRDDSTELIVSNPGQNAVFSWSDAEKRWKKLGYALPEGVSIVTADGADNGVRFHDFNGDGNIDVIHSNPDAYGLWLHVPELFLGFKQGWSREILRARRAPERSELPMIARGGEFPNNGAWFAKGFMWVQNEDTAKLPDLVDRVRFADMLNGFQPAPKEPKEALQTLSVAPEHIVELVAHEPAVQDPVAFEWGADGTLWVVEMRDYPSGVHGGGAIKRLRDSDADGFFESASLFADGLNFPNGLLPWKDGVLVSAAPNILFLRDENGDGKADRTEILFRGFGEGNQQHRMNGFELGLDNWIHGANGDSGGKIEGGAIRGAVSIGGRDFRFRPSTGEFQATAGQTQFGRRRDDWGNWFGGANYTWGWHYHLPEEYLARNPTLAAGRSNRLLNRDPDGTRVFAISRVQQRFNDIGMAGHVTSACSVAPFRDDLFGPEFERSVLIAEPTHNLIHREVLEVDGVSFASRRSPSEKSSEFLASTDPWFRPVNIKTGPDGAIYFADMYRLVIEHPEWIPDDVKQRIDLRAGENRGRIYRVRPRHAQLRQPAPLHQLRGADLARALNSPNGWQRDTVHRLLLERQDREAAPVLADLAASSDNPKARLQALCALDGLSALGPGLLLGAIQDPNPYVREHAIRLAEPFLENEAILGAVLDRANDPELRVRRQVAFSLGESNASKAVDALASILARDGSDADATTAVLSSASKIGGPLLLAVLRTGANNPGIERVVTHLSRSASSAEALGLLEEHSAQDDAPGWKILALARMLDSQKSSLAKLRERAASIVASESAPEADRLALLELVENSETIARLLGSAAPSALQASAVERLAELNHPSAPILLLDRWRAAAPQARRAMTVQFLRRVPWTRALLDRVASGGLDPAEVAPAVREALLAHRSEEIRAKAGTLFKAAAAGRDDLVRAMASQVLQLPGRPEQGRALFEQHCSVCHRAGQSGAGAGPNLAMLKDQGAESFLAAVLDPNRAVEEKFWSCTIELKNGDEFTGILLSESANSLALMGISGVEQSFLRREIAAVRGSSRSIMPEGFEHFLKAQDFADLFAFVRASR